MTMADVDADLAVALKMAKSKKMFFAFVPKGSDGKLIVSKAKIPAKVIAEAKKEIGGGNAITGKCLGPIANMVFFVAKQAPPTMEAALKKVAKRDSGLSVIPEVQLAGDADAEEADDSAAAAAPPAGAPGATPAGAAQAAPPAAPAAGNLKGIQVALQKLGYDPGKIDGAMGPHTQAAIKKFQQANGLAADGVVGPKTQAALAKALQGGAPAGGAPPEAGAAGGAKATPAGAPNLAPWQAARQVAINDLKALATKVAGTKHGSAAGVLKEIQGIIGKLPANPAANDIDKLEAFVREDDTITAAEEVPGHFHKLDIRKPLLDALEALRK
jgi:peptidoglycan hydrolase-like protein with peptidoglycan-binding domain